MVAGQRRQLSLVHRFRAPVVETVAPGRPPLLILLHGIGSNELAMASLAGDFDPRFAVMSVRSPIEVGPFAYAWFHMSFEPAGPRIDADEAAVAWERLGQFVDEAVSAYDTDPRRTFIGGFSQGGMMALASMLTSPERLAGVVCLSGHLPEAAVARAAAGDRLRGKPVLIVHGTGDQTLPIGLGRRARDILSGFPLAVDYREFEMGHTTTDESVAAASAWLTTKLPPSSYV
jgi:phospholipase/carboxylesterase